MSERKFTGAWAFVFEDKARRERELRLRYESQRMAFDSWARLQAAQANNLSDPIAGQQNVVQPQTCGVLSAAMFSTLLGGSLHLANHAFAMEPVSDDPLAGVVGSTEIILVDDPADDAGGSVNLYLISQDVNHDFDTYDSAVVAANSPEDAATIHPARIDAPVTDDEPEYGTVGSWCKLSQVVVKHIGTATEGTPRGVICASFNAG